MLRYLLVMALCGLFNITRAQPIWVLDTLEEVVLSANKTEEKMSSLPFKIDVITSRKIDFINPQNSADMLVNTGDVFVQKSNLGGGSPVLRGFEASRILLVVDGVRLNNAIYRAGHLQDVMSLDNAMLDRTEIIFGPSSVMYGSDALGGVMHFYTKKPRFGEDSMNVKGNTHFRWSSVNDEFTGHVDLNLGWKKVASLTSFTYSSFGDLRSGHNLDPFYDSLWLRNYYVERINDKDSMIKNEDPYLQKFTGYTQYDLLQKFAIKQGHNIMHSINFQYSNTGIVPRYDRLTDLSSNGIDLKYAEWNYGPQKRLMTSYNILVSPDKSFYDMLSVTAAWQNTNQERITRRYRKNFRTTQFEDVMVYSLNADFKKTAKKKHDLRYGVEFTYNDVQSAAHTLDIVADTTSRADTRYPDGGSSMMSVAAYFSHSWMISEKLYLHDGVRFSYQTLAGSFDDTTSYPFPFKEYEQKNSAPTFSLGLVMKPLKGLKISLLGSSGFRCPNVDDASRFYASIPGQLIVPNVDLKPEFAYNGELGVSYTTPKNVRYEITGWYTRLVNAIVLRPTTYEGLDSIVYDGSLSQVMSAQNVDDAMITGVSGKFSADFNDHWSLVSSVSYTYGRYHDNVNDTIVPMDHIPPVFGQTSLLYHGNKLEGEFYVRYNGWKMLKDYSPSGEDNLNYAAPGYGMPSWATLNLRLACGLGKHLKINTGLENILDEHYRVFASGVSAGGRNLYVSLRGTF